MLSASMPQIAAAQSASLGVAVIRAQQIAAQRLEAGAIASQKCGVVPLFDQQRMRQRQHQRGVGIRTDREPLGIEKLGCIRVELGLITTNSMPAALARPQP